MNTELLVASVVPIQPRHAASQWMRTAREFGSDFMDAIVATCGTAKCYGHGFVRLEGQIAALTTDPAWQGGDYRAPPTKGLEAFSMVWAGWLYSQEWWRKELWRTISPVS